jgi:hypothetical protein
MLFVRAATDRVVRALDAAAIPALLLKGAALLETVYADPAQREMLDIDILVPIDRLPAANEALAPLGYRPLPGSEGLAGQPEQLRVAAPHHDPALVGEQQLVAVELHHHVAIAGEGRFEIAGFWERARTVPSTGHRVPSPEDLLLHVCLHFIRNRLGGSFRRRHTGGALAQIFDINQIVEAESIDWDAFVQAAGAYDLGAKTFLGLFAARQLGVAIPDAALSELRPRGFDDAIGRHLVALRVLRAGEQLPVRSMRWMFAPSREILSRGWSADPTAPLSLARAYMRRARTHAPAARSTLRRPRAYLQDQRLNSQIKALEDRA